MKMNSTKISNGILKAHNHYLSAVILLKQGDYEKALSYFKQARDSFKTELIENSQIRGKDTWISELNLIEQEIKRIEVLSNKKPNFIRNQAENDLIDLIESMRHVYQKSKEWQSNVVGLDLAKKTLDDVISIPLERTDIWIQSNKPPRSVLLFGPPGCGKTVLIKALAQKTGLPFFYITPGKIMSKWFGESEKNIERIFQRAHQEKNGCILFFDEFDALVPEGKNESGAMIRVQKSLLTALDGFNTPKINKIVVIAVTNRPDRLNGAMIRRFDRRVYLSPPDVDEILKLILNIINPLGISSEVYSEPWTRIINSMLGLTFKEISDIVHGAIWGSYASIGDDNSGIEIILRLEIKKLLTNLTPYFCTFESLEPSVYLFLDQQYGFPKTNHTGYSWEDDYMKRKHELIQFHPKPHVIYKRKTERKI